MLDRQSLPGSILVAPLARGPQAPRFANQRRRSPPIHGGLREWGYGPVVDWSRTVESGRGALLKGGGSSWCLQPSPQRRCLNLHADHAPSPPANPSARVSYTRCLFEIMPSVLAAPKRSASCAGRSRIELATVGSPTGSSHQSVDGREGSTADHGRKRSLQMARKLRRSDSLSGGDAKSPTQGASPRA